MRSSLPALRTLFTALATTLALSMAAQAQFAPAPERAAAPPRVTAPSPRAAACHNGQSFERFLAELKQKAVADGVSQRAIAEASPYLVFVLGFVFCVCG